MSFSFTVLHEEKNTQARLGKARTLHGEFDTPAFMPVGTHATVKTLTPEDIRECGAEIILGNSYHLYLRPGHKTIEELGGLHRFMNWDGPILTDSGGFQIFSLGPLTRIFSNRVKFKSHIDGSEHVFSPETSIEVQESLGADIIMAFDECLSYPSSYEETLKSTELTTEWAKKCREVHQKENALFGIVQGGMFRDLREKSAEGIIPLDFDGYALGGVSVGEPKELLYEVMEYSLPLIPFHKPRYVMGLGDTADILKAVSLGADMFDCVIPTRNARNGTLLTRSGKIVIKNSLYRRDENPVDPACGCYTCRHYSRAYLRHLFLSREVFGLRLNTIHNIFFYSDFMRRVREAIRRDKLIDFMKDFAFFDPSEK